MKYTLGICRVLLLLTIGLILVACGRDDDNSEAHDTDTLAISTQSPAQVESSPPAESTNDPGEADTEDPPAPRTENDEQAAVAPGNVDTDISDNPWGKEIPEGPAPTVPPNPSSNFDSDGDGLYTIEEFEEAIRYRYSEYEWPPNYQMTEDRLIEAMRFDSFPEGSRFEAPGEYTALGLMHECAWELTLIDAALENDQELIDESLYQLVEFGQNKNPLSRDENGKAFMRDMYDRAALGDVAPLQQWVDNNCEQRRQYFITPESATPPSARSPHTGESLAYAQPIS